MIKTGYFAKHKGTDGVSIALYPPKFFKGRCYSALAPTPQILEWWKSSEQDAKAQNIYRRLYFRDVLNKLDVHEVARALEGKTLLCFERPDEFCHRHLVADWLTASGYPCKEEDPMSEQELYEFYGQLYELFGKDLKIVEE